MRITMGQSLAQVDESGRDEQGEDVQEEGVKPPARLKGSGVNDDARAAMDSFSA